MSQESTHRHQSPGDRLVTVRGKRSQFAFAEELGISRSSLQHYEAGTRKMDADLLVRLRVLLKIDPLWLLTGEDRGGLEPQERALLDAFKSASDEGRCHLLTASQWVPKR
ncbi:MAG: helix-turn-helix domain-containing protein [Proteobacteria bacterium]|nr:helix-turn-helix domain-containing protein [Pseudomonadota bacterium]